VQKHFIVLFRAGGNIATLDDISFLPTPPLSLLIDQKLIESTSRTSDGEKVKHAHTEQELFGICCSVNENALTLYGTELKVQLDTPTSVPNRTACSLAQLLMPDGAPGPTVINGDSNSSNGEPSAKRAKIENIGSPSVQDLMVEVERFASILSNTLGLDE
jgi:hypothetical protein